jgi:hypothetical protein
MNVILLHIDHRHVSATRVAIFSAVTSRNQIHLHRVGITPQLKIIDLAKIPVEWYNSDGYKIFVIRKLLCGVWFCV